MSSDLAYHPSMTPSQSRNTLCPSNRLNASACESLCPPLLVERSTIHLTASQGSSTMGVTAEPPLLMKRSQSTRLSSGSPNSMASKSLESFESSPKSRKAPFPFWKPENRGPVQTFVRPGAFDYSSVLEEELRRTEGQNERIRMNRERKEMVDTTAPRAAASPAPEWVKPPTGKGVVSSLAVPGPDQLYPTPPGMLEEIPDNARLDYAWGFMGNVLGYDDRPPDPDVYEVQE
ncbi:hypothetical protein D9611_002934 [Ephemerocybe angulata]|uniref:Uncharacterized protein n=1 Tax=Ephemerocybe angulata TaxID=980116 RepID=A0A8H5C8P8_9AGAR|nr:hypothetical protein D9611_002934 [Tulosesus angulatus]